jgi:hypothetical protein
MEAATPLRPPSVRTAGDRLFVDGLVLDDECSVRLAREREELGGEPDRELEEERSLHETERSSP